MSNFKKFGEVIIHDCRNRNGLPWDHEGVVIWYHPHTHNWYMYDERMGNEHDSIIHYCPLCGVRLDHYFVKKPEV